MRQRGGTRTPPGGGTRVRYPPHRGGTQTPPGGGGTRVRYPPGGLPGSGTPRGGYPGQVPPGGVPKSGTPPGGYPDPLGGYPGQVPSRGGTQVRYPPGGVYPGRTTEGVLTTRRAVCLLRSRRRTFLLQTHVFKVKNQQKKLPLLRIEPGTSYGLLWCLSDWTNVAFVCKVWDFQILKKSCSLDFSWVQKSIGAPAEEKLNIPQLTLEKLARSGGIQNWKQEIPSSILTGGYFFAEFFLCYPCVNLYCQYCQFCVFGKKLY